MKKAGKKPAEIKKHMPVKVEKASKSTVNEAGNYTKPSVAQTTF
jgi:hypothetical protein